MNVDNTSDSKSLSREIGFLALLFTGITGIIGSGWLFASMYAAQIAGPCDPLMVCRRFHRNHSCSGLC